MNSFENEGEQLKAALAEFQAAARFRPDDLIAFGCSSSEIVSFRIGSATNMEAARALLPVMQEWGAKRPLPRGTVLFAPELRSGGGGGMRRHIWAGRS